MSVYCSSSPCQEDMDVVIEGTFETSEAEQQLFFIGWQEAALGLKFKPNPPDDKANFSHKKCQEPSNPIISLL